MAQALKDNYGIDVVHKIAHMINRALPTFKCEAFIDYTQSGYEALELMERGRKISKGLKAFLPDDYQQAVTVILDAVEPPIELDENNSIATFLYMPFVNYVAENGLHDFDVSMHALYVLTQKFTSEFGIRPFIEKYPEQSLLLLQTWTKDPNYHVRRLVSEGTRTRLPWASRLPQFIEDPTPVVGLLESLKDDTELYVRRSVANNLNDIGKDHPDLLADIAKRWLIDAPEQRQWLVKHALRSAIKRGEKGALEALGYGKTVNVEIQKPNEFPAKVSIGSNVTIQFILKNNASEQAKVMVDFAIHFIKANGSSSAKVFKLKALELAPNESQVLNKKVSMKKMTTRSLYPGTHKIEVIINGQSEYLGKFELVL